MVSAVKRVEFVSDRISYKMLKGRFVDVIGMNVHAPTEYKIDDMKNRDFSAKVGREDIFKQTFGNESLHEINCDTHHTDHYLVVAKVRERLAVSKQTAHRVHMERFNLKKLNEVEGKEQFRFEISNRFAALENLDTEVDIRKTWETIRENIKMSAKNSLGYYELKKHKPWFDEGCLKLWVQRKQAKLQWLQDPSELNGDNLNNIRRETSRHFRNKKGNI
ncbi:hypothetical protein B7P43_G17402 [Cryptotermes secundus]|uniref:Uncharacterized protein n=1 Tax=Cryptotermes secundus TaxID=105785 RepID=A0A2J7QY88_9NEOP|nr:hypothetical protein B7P43_G17402 [Cryptotermes secundus]